MIKWRKQDENLLKKEIRRYNAKIKRLSKLPKYADVELPELKKYKQVREEIVSRDTFNREIKSLQSIFDKGAAEIIENKKGLKVTKYQYKELKKDVSRINRQRAKERERNLKIPVVTGVSNETGLTRGEMVNIRAEETAPKKFDFDKLDKGRSWEKFVESVEKQSRDTYTDEQLKRFKENYMKAVHKELTDFEAEINEKVTQIDARSFFDLYLKYEEMAIEYVYGLQEMEFKANIIISIIDREY